MSRSEKWHSIELLLITLIHSTILWFDIATKSANYICCSLHLTFYPPFTLSCVFIYMFPTIVSLLSFYYLFLLLVQIFFSSFFLFAVINFAGKNKKNLIWTPRDYISWVLSVCKLYVFVFVIVNLIGEYDFYCVWFRFRAGMGSFVTLLLVSWHVANCRSRLWMGRFEYLWSIQNTYYSGYFVNETIWVRVISRIEPKQLILVGFDSTHNFFKKAWGDIVLPIRNKYWSTWNWPARALKMQFFSSTCS